MNIRTPEQESLSMSHTSVIKGFMQKYRPLLSLAVAALLAELAYAILNLSAMPVWVEYDLHLGQYLGFIISTFLLTEAMARPVFGALGDKIGRKPLLIAGPAITAVTSYLTVRFHGPYALLGLFALRALDGFGSAALWPSAFAAIGDIVEEKNRSAAMSVLNVTYMAGLALGFPMGGWVNELMNSHMASFYLVSVLLVLCVIVMVVFLPKRIGVSPHAHEELHGEPGELPTLEEPSSFKLSNLLHSFYAVPEMIVLACIVFFGTGLLMPIVKLYAIEHLGLTEVKFGLAVAPAAAFMGIFALPLGRLGDKYGKCVAVCWGIFASATAMWILALFRSVILAGLAGVILGLGFTVAFPAWMALVSSATSKQRRGEVLGAVGMAQGLAAILGTSLGAWIYHSDAFSFPRLGVVNYNVPFWFSAVLLSIGTIMSFTWVARKHCNSDAGLIRDWQRKLVLGTAVVGLITLGLWIGVRYTQPVAPDRVAWQWVQQLYENRPQKAARFTVPEIGSIWNGRKASEETAKKIQAWKKEHSFYTVMNAESASDDRVKVPVRFRFPDKTEKWEYVLMCRQPTREWKVCGITGD